MDRDDTSNDQITLFDPDAFVPWKRALGRLVLAVRRGEAPKSLTELRGLTGVALADLRRCERDAQREARS